MIFSGAKVKCFFEIFWIVSRKEKIKNMSSKKYIQVIENYLKKWVFTLCIIILSSTIRGQTVGEPSLSFTLSPLTIRARHYNFGFENVAVKQTRDGWWLPSRWDFAFIGDKRTFFPVGWFQLGYGDYTATLDSVEKHSGRYSALIERVGNSGSIGGSICYVIPAEYGGKRIEVKAWLKGEGTDNTIGLMLQFDGEPNVIRMIDEMKRKNISTHDEWTEYSVSARLPEETETIRIGAILVGNGRLWVDDFRVLIDGKDIRDLQASDLKYKALNDDEFDEGSYINFGTLTPQMTDNLALLAKVWGFAKYYHPAVGSGDYHWDYVLFKAMASMLNAQNIDERNTVLYALLYGLGDFRTVRRLNIPDSKNVKMLPDLDWINDRKTFGDDLSKKLNEVKMARRGNTHHYIGLYINQASKFRHEYDYPHISPDDDGYRMLALFRFWNMVQYFYPYKYRLKENWHDTLIEFIPKVAHANSSNYKQVFTELVLRLGDPQTFIASESPDFGNNAPPLQIRFVENKPVVTGITMVDLSVELAPGDVIVKINQKPVEDIMEQIRKKLESRYFMPNLIHYSIVTNILRTDDDFILVEYQRDGRNFTANLRCYTSETLYENRIVNTLPGHELLNDDIGYFCPPFFNNDKINEAMSEFSDTKGIVIDLRNPLTYNWAYVIARFLTATPVYFSKKTKADIQIPGLFTYSNPQRIGVRNRRYYTGKIVVLVNQNTNQYCELTAMAFRALPNTVIIGSATGYDRRFLGYSPSSFQLPGNIFGSISGHGMYYPDGNELMGVGIVPDIEVKPTIRGIIEGRDEVLERAIQIIENQSK